MVASNPGDEDYIRYGTLAEDISIIRFFRKVDLLALINHQYVYFKLSSQCDITLQMIAGASRFLDDGMIVPLPAQGKVSVFSRQQIPNTD